MADLRGAIRFPRTERKQVGIMMKFRTHLAGVVNAKQSSTLRRFWRTSLQRRPTTLAKLDRWN